MERISLSEFADRINEIMPMFIKEFARRQISELFKTKITLPQFLILLLLQKQGELKMTGLARFMKVSTAAMTGLVDRLVKYGYILRVTDPADRRIIKVRLTTKGIDLVRKINKQRKQMIINIFGRLSRADRENYLRILMRIKDILSKEKEDIES